MKTFTIMELLENDVELFPSEYPFYNESLKPQFEKKFKNTFLTCRIGFETIGLFKHFLKQSLYELYPYYKHLYETTSYTYNPILNYDVKEEIIREITTDNNVNTNGEDITTFFASPRINTTDYKKSPSNIGENNRNNNVNSIGNQKETNTRNTSGNIGVMTTQDLITKERSIIINIDKLILEELNNLFMGVYE